MTTNSTSEIDPSTKEVQPGEQGRPGSGPDCRRGQHVDPMCSNRCGNSPQSEQPDRGRSGDDSEQAERGDVPGAGHEHDARQRGDEHHHEDTRPHTSTPTKGPDGSCVAEVRRRASGGIAENVHSDLLRRLEVQPGRQGRTGTTVPKRGVPDPDVTARTDALWLPLHLAMVIGLPSIRSPLLPHPIDEASSTSRHDHNLPRRDMIKSVSRFQ